MADAGQHPHPRLWRHARHPLHTALERPSRRRRPERSASHIAAAPGAASSTRSTGGATVISHTGAAAAAAADRHRAPERKSGQQQRQRCGQRARAQATTAAAHPRLAACPCRDVPSLGADAAKIEAQRRARRPPAARAPAYAPPCCAACRQRADADGRRRRPRAAGGARCRLLDQRLESAGRTGDQRACGAGGRRAALTCPWPPGLEIERGRIDAIALARRAAVRLQTRGPGARRSAHS